MRRTFSILSLIIALSLYSTASSAREGLATGRDGLTYQSGDVELSLGGRLHLDAAAITEDGDTEQDEEIRRARLEFAARYGGFRLRVDREFAHGGGWRNVFASYDFSDALSIRAGNFIAPFSMEDGQSSNAITFMERSLPNALAPGYGLGGAVSYDGDHWQASGGYFTDAIDNEDDRARSQGNGFAARASVNLAHDDDRVLHLGIGVQRREFEGGDELSFSTRPEASLSPIILRSGAIAAPSGHTAYNVEAAWASGPLLVQGQYLRSSVEQSAAPDLDFDGYYVQAAWIVTGEPHEYSDGAGVFTGVRPRSKWGAVELAARYSELNLDDAAVGGRAKDATAGVNWYVGRNVRLMGNYVHSEVSGSTPLLDRELDIVEARMQVNF